MGSKYESSGSPNFHRYASLNWWFLLILGSLVFVLFCFIFVVLLGHHINLYHAFWPGLCGLLLKPGVKWFFALLVILILGYIMFRAAVELRIQLRAERERRCYLEQFPILKDGDLSDELKEFLKKEGLLGQLVVVEDENCYAFVSGLIRRKMVISTGLFRLLSFTELKAVLLHEAYHLQSRDPIRIFVARILTGALFFIPLSHRLYSAYQTGRELAADSYSMTRTGRSDLCSAMLKLIMKSKTGDLLTAGSGILNDRRQTSGTLLNKRIALISDRRSLHLPLPVSNLILTGLGVTVLYLLIFSCHHGIH